MLPCLSLLFSGLKYKEKNLNIFGCNVVIALCVKNYGQYGSTAYWSVIVAYVPSLSTMWNIGTADGIQTVI